MAKVRLKRSYGRLYGKSKVKAPLPSPLGPIQAHIQL